MVRKRRVATTLLLSVAALLSASMLAPAFGAPQAVSAASLAKQLSATLKIAKRADRNAKRAIKGLQVEGGRGPAGPAGARGVTGAKGDQGVAGANGSPGTNGGQGAPGEPATQLWANIEYDGSILDQSGSTTSNKLTSEGSGAYEVLFDRDVSHCNYQATVANQPGMVLVSPRAGNANGVYVATRNAAAAVTDIAFHLAVFC